jgi:threonine aldolase
MNHEYSFYNDYSEGAHPRILEALTKSNTVQESGYGEDSFSREAASLIKERIKNPDAAVHFVSGGTQANLIVLASMMKPFEAVIAAKTAHINVHEAGAIEATGHKVISVESSDGKIKPDQVEQQVRFHSDEHMVKPKVVFVSDATELGTVYTKKELEEVSKVCKKNNLYLYLDGARLGSALTAKGSDKTLSVVSDLVDIFYIGGTKNGALLGEAVVINNPTLQTDFRYYLKQHGALLAKGRVLGIQFLELFKDDLFFDLSRHANEMAGQLVDGIANQGHRFLAESSTNQIFPILPNSTIEQLKEKYGFYVWSEVDAESSAIRLVTSWATPQEAVDKFLANLGPAK